MNFNLEFHAFPIHIYRFDREINADGVIVLFDPISVLHWGINDKGVKHFIVFLIGGKEKLYLKSLDDTSFSCPTVPDQHYFEQEVKTVICLI